MVGDAIVGLPGRIYMIDTGLEDGIHTFDYLDAMAFQLEGMLRINDCLGVEYGPLKKSPIILSGLTYMPQPLKKAEIRTLKDIIYGNNLMLIR